MRLGTLRYDSGHQQGYDVKPAFIAPIFCDCGACTDVSYKYCPACGRLLPAKGSIVAPLEEVMPLMESVMKMKLEYEISKFKSKEKQEGVPK